MCFSLLVLEDLLEFVIEYQHQRTTYTSPEITKIAIKEALDPLLRHDLLITIHSASVDDISPA